MPNPTPHYYYYYYYYYNFFCYLMLMYVKGTSTMDSSSNTSSNLESVEIQGAVCMAGDRGAACAEDRSGCFKVIGRGATEEENDSACGSSDSCKQKHSSERECCKQTVENVSEPHWSILQKYQLMNKQHLCDVFSDHDNQQFAGGHRARHVQNHS